MQTTGADHSTPGLPPARIPVAIAVLQDLDRRVFLCKRPLHVHQGGKWEFPGGKCEPGETPWQALHRELKEELNLEPLQAEHLITVPYDYLDRRVLLYAWLVRDWRGSLPAGEESSNHAWAPCEELWKYPLPAANRGILNALSLPSLCAIAQVPAEEKQLQGQFQWLLAKIELCFAAGLRLLYLRGKGVPGADYESAARQVACLGASFGVSLLLDARHAEVVRAIPHAGLHFGVESLGRAPGRPAVVSSRHLLSAACHNAAELERARLVGVDLLLLSPVRETSSHPERQSPSRELGWEKFRALSSQASVPVYALGGMRPEHLRDSWSAGAQGIAMLSGLWEASDPAQEVIRCLDADRNKKSYFVSGLGMPEASSR